MGAALEEMERGDRFAVNFNRIARELGVSHSAIYRHFPNNQALIDALARRGFEQLGSDLGAALAELEGSGAGARIRPEFHTVSAQRSLPDSRQNGGCIRIPAECVARC